VTNRGLRGMSRVKVRIALPQDYPQIEKLALEANEEIGLASPVLEKIRAGLWPLVNRQGGLIGVIGPVGGELEGMIILGVISLWYSDEAFLEERVVFVSKQFRTMRGGRGTKLCEFSKKVADELQIPLLIGISTSIDFDPKVRMYKRIFGKQAGAFFLYGRRHYKDGFNPTLQAAE